MPSEIDDFVVRARIDRNIKDQATEVLQSMGLTISDLLREVLLRVAQDKQLPFPVRSTLGAVYPPELSRKMDERYLPELHQARWAEKLAELSRERRAAETPEEREAISERIQEHYRGRFDLDPTRQELGLDTKGKDPGDPEK